MFKPAIAIGLTLLTAAPAVADDVRATPEQGTPGQQNGAGPGHGGAANIGNPFSFNFLRQTFEDLDQPPPALPLEKNILDGFGVCTHLQDEGLTAAGTWTIDYSKPLQGGRSTRDDVDRNLLDLRLNFDLAQVAHMVGGTFSIDFQNQAGRNESALVGDVQGFDNIDADGRTQIAELWYQQKLLGDRLRFKIGKVDANTEFAFPDFGGGFINSSIGHSPTLTGFPTYPDGATSFNLFVYPRPWMYVGAGAYDGSLIEGIHTGSYGPSKLWHSSESFFFIGETGARWSLEHGTMPGHVGLGSFYHTGRFKTFDGGDQTGAAGEYLTLEQKVICAHPRGPQDLEGVYALLQYAHADPHVSRVQDYLGGGITWSAPYHKTLPDSMGVAVEAAHLSDAEGARFTRRFETDVETYYNFQVRPYLAIKPDLQYILNTGGNRAIKDALVATLRVTVTF